LCAHAALSLLSLITLLIAAVTARPDTDVQANARLDTVVLVNTTDVFRPAVFLDTPVVVNRRAVDALALDGGGVNARITRG